MKTVCVCASLTEEEEEEEEVEGEVEVQSYETEFEIRKYIQRYAVKSTHSTGIIQIHEELYTSQSLMGF